MIYLVVGIAVALLLGLLLIYNNLIGTRNQADNAFSTIDVMLKKRWDLIPNLIATAKGYMQHEASLLERIASLRTAALNSPSLSNERMSAEGQLTNALSQFRVLVESYPDLKASDQFLRLQAALNECEEQISAARRAFNAATLQYNNSVEMFPQSLIANFFGFKRKAFFEIAEGERISPRVQDQLS